jgi:predicted RNase H-like HicB family nuclease
MDGTYPVGSNAVSGWQEYDHMDRRSFQVVLEWDPSDRVWVTYVPALDFLSTFAETREEALANTREAILGYFEAIAKEQSP